MVSRDGRSVYVANQSTSQIFQYDVRVDGTLLPKSPDTVAAGQEPFGVAVSPDGKSVYVANVHQRQRVAVRRRPRRRALAQEPGHGARRQLPDLGDGGPGRPKRLRHQRI